MPTTSDHERTILLSRLAGGLNDGRPPAAIRDDQARAIRNIELDRHSLASTRGSLKLNNQQAPKSAVRTRVDPALSPLYIRPGVSVPLRGYVYLPYDERYDIGGRGPSSGSIPGGDETFHATRGQDFSISFSFQLPAEEQLHSLRNGADSGPENSPTDADVIALQDLGGYAIALDECSLVLQKGGDRLPPMSWAFGVVNVADKLEYMTGSTWTGASTYLPVFMWLDAPAWGYPPSSLMEYSLSNTQIGAGEDQFATGALRAIVATQAILPGQRYHVSLDLGRDTGSPGTGATPTPSWNGDGRFAIAISEEYEAPTVHTAASGLYVWKGPTDSIEYLEKYGVRFTGKDAMFGGLGMRQAPYYEHGFIPTGLDGASLEKGGHKMLDLSVAPAPAAHSLTAEHLATGDSFIEVNHQYLYTGNATQQYGQLGLKDLGTWNALESNVSALRNYWGVLYPDGAGDKHNGLRVKLGDYSESGPSFRLEADLAGRETWGPRELGIIAFRWSQREVVLEGLKIRNAPVDYSADGRRKLALRSHIELDDATEPDRESLVAYWPMTDAQGAALEERIAGRWGYLMPFGLGVSENGTRGENLLALSGEGEAVTLDFSEHPALKPVIERMLAGEATGIAVEVTCVFPEATYALGNLLEITPDVLIEGEFAPDIVTWETKDPSADGLDHTPNPIIRLTQRARWDVNQVTPTRFPMGFWAAFAQGSDQADERETEVFEYWDSVTGDVAWDLATWVGRSVTFQLGIQSTGTADEYIAYLAAVPKGDLNQAEGDLGAAEFAYFSAPVTITRKDLVRSVVTIGGAWNPGALGYTELNARILLDEVRVFAATPPGALPLASGSSVTDGKILGGRALPSSLLEAEDLVHPLGPAVETVDVIDGSATITAPGNGRFYEGAARDSIRALAGSLLKVAGDVVEVREEQTIIETFEEIYRVESVAAGGQTATLDVPYRAPSRSNAQAYAIRAIGYTAFEDDLVGRDLSLGRGRSFSPGTTTAADVVTSEDLWFNKAPVELNFRARIYSPLGHASLKDLLPAWVRGIKEPRRNPCLGIRAKDGIIYGAFQGAIYEADDRWRKDGPTELLTRALAFRAEETEIANVLAPLEADRVESAAGSAWTSSGFQGKCRKYDAWVRHTGHGGLQTILWVGDRATNPLDLAGPSGHRVQVWIRLRSGRPELCVGSSDFYAGQNRPDEGLYTAIANVTIPADKWTHVRWYLRTNSQNTYLLEPRCRVNGRLVTVSINAAAGAAVSPQWVTLLRTVLTLDEGRVYLGTARAAVDAGEADGTWVEDDVGDAAVRPGKRVGWLHNLDGELADVVVQLVGQSEFDEADFIPEDLEYADAEVLWRMRMQEGAGHRVDAAGTTATIVSHPFISRFHEFGRSTEPVSFAHYLSQLYAANGGRVAVVDERLARFADLQPPTTKPTFTTERVPNWKENLQVASPDGADNDPVAGAADGVDPRIYHHSSHGTIYPRQAFHSEMTWQQSGTDFGIFAFKCYVRMRSVAGRVPLYSARASTESGGIFVEIRDGKVVVGWYDTVLKREVFVGHSAAVVPTGEVAYIYVRKRFPMKDGWQTVLGSGSSNWANSVVKYTANQTYDSIVVRVFPKSTPPGFEQRSTTATIGAARNAVSFTVDEDMQRPSGTTAAGLVTQQLVVTATGNTITDVNSGGFHADMRGMLWQFGTHAVHGGELYRILSATADTLTVIGIDDGTVPSLNAPNPTGGGVFTGISLVKSAGFDDSANPDDAIYDIELFGSELSADETSGISPFDGEVWSAAYYVGQHTGSEDVDLFESFQSDRIETGTDAFAEAIHNPGAGDNPGPGELSADGGATFFETQCRTYATSAIPDSSQPNADLEIEPGANSSVNAPSWFLQYVTEPDILRGATRLQVIFYDRDRALRSNPGPELVIEPAQEDLANASGAIRYLLTDLPVSRAPGRIERWIYASLPGGGNKFLVARVPDNTSDSIALVITTALIAQANEALSFSNGPVPQCAVLGIAYDALWCGALRFAPEAIMWSKRFEPAQFPPGNFLPLISEGTGRIVSMGELKGRMIVYKRDAMWRIALEGGAPIAESVTKGTGCVSEQGVAKLDERHEFMTDRGPAVYMGQGLPAYVGDHVRGFFTDDADEREAEVTATTINRRRNQYVATIHERSNPHVGQRLSSEFDSALSGVASGVKEPANHRYSRYEDPMLTALGRYREPGGGIERVLGGTDHGFLVWLDHPDTRLTLMREDFKGLAFTVGPYVDASTDRIPLPTGPGVPPADLDQLLGGVRGVPVHWLAPDNTLTRAYALAADDDYLYLDRVPAALPEQAAIVRVGSQRHLWESKWFSFGTPEQSKQLRWLDFVMVAQDEGLLVLEVLVDYEETARKTQTIDLTNGTLRVTLESLVGKLFLFRLRSEQPAKPIRFEILELAVRLDEQEQT